MELLAAKGSRCPSRGEATVRPNAIENLTNGSMRTIVCCLFVGFRLGSLSWFGVDWWLGRPTNDQEVAGSSLTHCTVDYGPEQASHASVTKLYNLVPVKEYSFRL